MSTKNDKDLVTHEEGEGQQGGLSRRRFLTGTGVLAGSAVVGGLLAGAGCTPKAEAAIKKAKGHVNHVSDICTGCRTCQLACVMVHEQVINPQLSRNRVVKDILRGHVVNVQYCQQCDDPKCLAACPTGALHVDEKTGARVIDQKVCIGCQSCLKACIFYSAGSTRIHYNPQTKKCLKCDLCGGDPQCVELCPLGASQLSWETYTIHKPGWDAVAKEKDANALDVEIKREFTGPYGGRIIHRDWTVVKTGEGVEVRGSWDSSEGGALKVVFHCEFYDAQGALLGKSDEHVYQQDLHEIMEIVHPFAIDDPSKIASVTLVAYVDYWVLGTDKES